MPDTPSDPIHVAMIPILPPSYPDSRPSLQTLPREIRDTIYELCLKSPSPIVVWSGSQEWVIPEDMHHPDCTCQACPSSWLKLVRYHSVEAASRENLALGLLHCNRSIGHESALTLYSKNTFRFDGYHNWHPISGWLETIGTINCAYLTNLEISALAPSRVRQHRDGTRVLIKTQIGGEEVWPRNHDLALSPDPSASIEGIVENINPEAESVFAALGRRREAGLTLFFNLESDVVPGVELGLIYNPGQTYFGLDLPNLIEKWRVKYTSNDETGPIEVIWRAEALHDEFLEQKYEIENCGWDIIGTEVCPVPPPTDKDTPQHDLDAGVQKSSVVKFSMRRKPITGLLVAEGPYKYSWQGY